MRTLKERPKERPKSGLGRVGVNKSMFVAEVRDGSQKKPADTKKKHEAIRLHKRKGDEINPAAAVNKSSIDIVNAYKAERERERSVSTRQVDRIVRDNLRRMKERKDRERLQRKVREDQARQNKEQISEKNREIREMNARRARLPSQDSLGHKFAWGVDQQRLKIELSRRESAAESFSSHRRVSTNRDRITELQQKFAHKVGGGGQTKGKENVESNKDSREQKMKVCINLSIQGRTDDQNSEQRKKQIRDYMTQKKQRTMLERRQRKTFVEKKKELIQANKARLEQFVHEAFSQGKENARVSPSEASEKKKRRIKTKHGKKGKKKSPSKKQIINIVLAKPSPQEERKPEEDGAIMRIIKRGLLEEIGLSAHREPTPDKKSVHASDSARVATQRPQSTERLREKVANLSKYYENLRARASAKKTAAVTRLQTCFRGHLARDMLRKLREEEAKRKEGERQQQQTVRRDEGKLPNTIQSPADSIISIVGPSVRPSETKEKGEEKEKEEEKKEEEKPAVGPKESVPVSVRDIREEPAPPQAKEVDISIISKADESSSQLKQDTSNVDITISMEKDGEELVEEEKMQEKLLQEIECVETQMQDIDIQDRERCKLIRYLDQNAAHAARPAEEPHKPKPDENPYALPEEEEAKGEEYTEEHTGGGEQNDSLEMMLDEATPSRPLFAKNSFHEFTLRKFRDLMKEDNLSNIIQMREKLLSFREQTEKKYIQKMYKARKYSPRTYYRKKQELEKWITKERVEIKKSRRQFIENWKRTANMIEETHQNALRVKRMVFEGTLNSDTNSTISVALNTSRPGPEGEPEDYSRLEPPKRRKYISQSEQKPNNKRNRKASERVFMSPAPAPAKAGREDDDIDHYLSEAEPAENVSKVQSSVGAAILIKDSEVPRESLPKSEPILSAPIEVKDASAVSPSAKAMETKEAEEEKLIVVQPPPAPVPTPKQAETSTAAAQPAVDQTKALQSSTPAGSETTDKIVASILSQLVDEETQRLFPRRSSPKKSERRSPPDEKLRSPQKEEDDGRKLQTEQLISMKSAKVTSAVGGEESLDMLLKQSLIYGTREGIDSSADYISDYLELLFREVVTASRKHFLDEINTPLVTDPLKVLEGLQSTETNVTGPETQSAIIPAEMQQRVSGRMLLGRRPPEEFLRECQRIYNRALYEAANEGLNLLRPYGLMGEPAPWSGQQRILFKSIIDIGLIIKNVKSMVLRFRAR